MRPGGTGNYRKIERRIDRNKIIDRLTYSPKKHKQKKVRQLRLELKKKVIPLARPTVPEPTKMKFGSFNINGLSIEAGWAIQQLITTRNCSAQPKGEV